MSYASTARQVARQSAHCADHSEIDRLLKLPIKALRLKCQRYGILFKDSDSAEILAAAIASTRVRTKSGHVLSIY